MNIYLEMPQKVGKKVSIHSYENVLSEMILPLKCHNPVYSAAEVRAVFFRKFIDILLATLRKKWQFITAVFHSAFKKFLSSTIVCKCLPIVTK